MAECRAPAGIGELPITVPCCQRPRNPAS
jgi:hypothetical protein